MTHSCPSVAAVAAVWLLGSFSALGAQATGTVDVGSSWVNYEGFLGSGAFFANPTLRYDTPNTSLGVSGSYVLFESGRHIVQGLAAGAWQTTIHDRFKGELSGSAGVNVYDNNPGYGHLLGRARLHLTGRLSGAWLGGATGQSYEGSYSSTPYELELGGWTVYDGVAIGAIAKSTWDAGVSYLDLVGTARWRDKYLEIDGSLGARGLSNGGGEGVYGELHAQIPILKQLSALISGGRYPTDPVRGVLAASYVSVSLRVNAFNSPTSASPAPQRTLFRELERPERPEVGEARLTIFSSLQNLQTIRIEAPNAQSVELTADFTDWRPISLRRVEKDTWEVTVQFNSGVHRVNVRLNGGSWIVPHGLRAEQDDFGGSVGLLVVR